MPLAHMIFFEEPREFTEAQIEEARSFGHLIEDEPPEPPGPLPPAPPLAAAPAPALADPAPAVAAAAEAGGTAVPETSDDAGEDQPPARDLFSTPPQVPDLSQADPGGGDHTDES